ncbi:MAG: hypothetical protein H6598_10270 [Flavobacteriales bacterium]|nr:hypothetical protein [Flavobacteriales bacterium]
MELYRYGFQGQEKDDEIKPGEGNSYAYTFRFYDPRLGRFLSIDPLHGDYPHLSPYHFCDNSPIEMMELEGLEGVSNKFKVGKPTKPAMSFDNGHLDYFSAREPSKEDLEAYQNWIGKLQISKYFRESWMEEAHAQYSHYLKGGGATVNLNMDSYYQNDISGDQTVRSVNAMVRQATHELIGDKTYLELTSEAFTAGDGDPRFPYPATENWQKAIGGHKFWISAEVRSREGEDGIMHYFATVTIHTEDMYNFDPGKQDIATGIPDEENGVFQITGLAHQFKTISTYTYNISWSQDTETLEIIDPQYQVNRDVQNNVDE